MSGAPPLRRGVPAQPNEPLSESPPNRLKKTLSAQGRAHVRPRWLLVIRSSPIPRRCAPEGRSHIRSHHRFRLRSFVPRTYARESENGQTDRVAAVSTEVTGREAEVLVLVGQHLTNAQIAKALSISAETLYVRAGILDAREGDGDVVQAILCCERLTEAQKQALLRVYQSFVHENGEDETGGAPAA